jgi:uncharacterized protein (TIGR02231 family)
MMSGFILAGSMATAVPVFAEMIDAASAITQAVVYPSSARVTRTARVDLKEGLQTIRLKGVPLSFDPNSLSVSGRGSAAARILSAGVKTEFLKDSPDIRVREIESRLVAVNDELAAFEGQRNVLQEKKAFLDSVRLFTGGQLPRDLVTKVPSAEELKATLTFIEDGTKAYQTDSLALNVMVRGKAQERDVLQQELNQLRSGVQRQEQALTVEVECDKGGSLDLEVAYTTPQVQWYPQYDARVEFERTKTALSAFAVVRQSSGEDWNNVQLTLSTARPSLGGQMPELNPWYLRPNVPQAVYASSVAMPRAMMLKSSMMMDSAAGASMEAAAPAVMQTAYAQSEASGVSLVYKAARPVTVKSDGSEVRVPLMVQSLDTVFEYAASPKLSPYAYLRSQVSNGSGDQLMAGRVNVFLDGTFVGNSNIGKTVAAGENFDLYLGVDEGVAVKRELVAEKADDTFIGNIPASTRKIMYTYKISAVNYKPRAAALKLFDQIPVSQDDKIKVVRVSSSIKPDTDKYRDREGVYLWTLTLQPKEKKEITITYVVEYPRDLVVQGL